MEPVNSSAGRTVNRTYDIFSLGYRASGRPAITIGLLIYDSALDRLWLNVFPNEIHGLVDADDLDIMELLGHDLRDKADEMGPSALLPYLLDSLSNTLIISTALPSPAIGDPERLLSRLTSVFGLPWPATGTIERIVNSDL